MIDYIILPNLGSRHNRFFKKETLYLIYLIPNQKTLDYNAKFWIFSIGMIIMFIGGGIFFISHGTWYGFYPTEAAAERGNFGWLIGIVGLAIMLFGLVFPSHKEPSLDDYSHTPLGKKYSELN